MAEPSTKVSQIYAVVHSLRNILYSVHWNEKLIKLLRSQRWFIQQRFLSSFVEIWDKVNAFITVMPKETSIFIYRQFWQSDWQNYNK